MILKLPPLDYRIPKWNHNDLHERYCPICNSADGDAIFIRPDSLNIRLCNYCNTFYVSPAPSNYQLSLFYAAYDEKHRRSPKLTIKELLHNYQNINMFDDLRIRELSSLMSFEGKKILDVGFGRAQLLYGLMKLGAIPHGVELDEKSIESAKALGICNILKGTLDDLDDEIKYDLIIMNDLVEHPLNVMGLLKKASYLIKPKGYLLIWTPNGEIANIESFPSTFRVDLEHMQYLTTSSCIYIASEIDLRVVHMETCGFPNLTGIDKVTLTGRNVTTQIKNAIKSVPGFTKLYNLRNMFVPYKNNDERNGTYNLFCIMQKPYDKVSNTLNNKT